MKKLFPVFLMAAVLSCFSKKDKVGEVIESQALVNARNNFLGQMRNAKDWAAEIQSTGADFNEALLSDPSNYTQFLGDTLKSAAVLGVYLSDLNYCVMYGKGELSRNQFNSAIELSKQLGVDNNVLVFLMSRYYENISQSDSLMNVINELFAQSTDALKDRKKERLLGVTIAGYQIESLHLALGIISKYPKELMPLDMRIRALTPLFEMVLRQQKTIEIIHAFLRALRNASDPNRTPNFSFYDQAFYELLEVYKRQKVQEVLANDRSVELLNDDMINELRDKVSAIRDEIVGF